MRLAELKSQVGADRGSVAGIRQPSLGQVQSSYLLIVQYEDEICRYLDGFKVFCAYSLYLRSKIVCGVQLLLRPSLDACHLKTRGLVEHGVQASGKNRRTKETLNKHRKKRTGVLAPSCFRNGVFCNLSCGTFSTINACTYPRMPDCELPTPSGQVASCEVHRHGTMNSMAGSRGKRLKRQLESTIIHFVCQHSSQ